MTAWVETQVPCMVYCGDELCNCEARFYYDLEEDWSILDKKEQGEKSLYETYLSRLQDYRLRGYPEVVLAKSKGTYTYPEHRIDFALKSNPMQSRLSPIRF